MKSARLPRAQHLAHHASEHRHAPTIGEAALWQCLRAKQLGVKFRRQSPVLNMILDFWCPTLRLAIEIDGPHHDAESDARRDDLLRRWQVTVLRYPHTMPIEEMLADIMRELRARGVPESNIIPKSKKPAQQYTLWPMCKLCDGTGWELKEGRAHRCSCRKQLPLLFDSQKQRDEYQRQQWMQEEPLTPEQQHQAVAFIDKLTATVSRKKAMGTVPVSEDDLAFERRYMG